ncbi:NAD(P)H-dependent FMN reductase [Inhella inkyongensis]|uniref:NAD(P)H-dependent FMN reductase n=1 Tax=Inhella inkyongensis TaxID=392593 RepID=A0A840S8P3_9BURK|nr:NAD(P)H-dependent oxidoreductase [Inhella inkyongensis]MBB5205164.1 NAD(P)H-dependent FMN reductase [Inhella inkyongensis]
MQVLILSGSARQGSMNTALGQWVAAQARAQGHAAELLDLRALALPIYDGDLEQRDGVPAGVQPLLAALQRADAVVVVSPEYNGFPTPLLINAFDWLSRLPEGTAATRNKPTALLAASAGMLGGLRGLNHLRAFLTMNFQMLLLPQQHALGRADQALSSDGSLQDAKAQAAVQAVLDGLLALAGRG